MIHMCSYNIGWAVLFRCIVYMLLCRKWGKETFDHLQALSCSADGGILQIFPASGYDLYKQWQPVLVLSCYLCVYHVPFVWDMLYIYLSFCLRNKSENQNFMYKMKVKESARVIVMNYSKWACDSNVTDLFDYDTKLLFVLSWFAYCASLCQFCCFICTGFGKKT